MLLSHMLACVTEPTRRACAISRLPLELLVLLCLIGCGTTKSRLATEQLLVSDAVDQAISTIDFGAMAGEKVYFDAQYVLNVKGVGFVNSEYIISSLRQQILAADCRLQENRNDADYIIEARIGTLGANGHEVVYGVPANNALSAASSLVPNTPSLPSIPELALAKKDVQLGAAKIAVFAYERENRRPVWQSGIAQAKSTAQDVWFFGAGPFQRGTIYEGSPFSGNLIGIPHDFGDDASEERPAVTYRDQFHFPRPNKRPDEPQVQVAGFEEPHSPVVLPPVKPPGAMPAPAPGAPPGPVPAGSPPAAVPTP